MNNSFEPAMRAVLEWEGGYVDNPDDPGGKTKYGISKKAHPDVDMRKLTKDKARKIYRADYWTPAGCDELPAGLDLIVFDAAVNCRVDRAIRFLQHGVGTKVDGIWGPNTRNAAQTADPKQALREIVARRGEYYGSLTDLFEDFGLGWMRRLSDMHQRALELIKTA